MAMANNPNIDIYLATKAGDFERVKYLVEVEDVNINRMDDHNSVPLFYACLCGHTELVRYLLDRGARLEAGTFVAERCFYGALNDEITHLLKTYKAKPESTDHLAERLRALLSDGFASDVTFVVENREINVHRFVLISRCDYFVKEFNGRWKDKSRVPLAHSSIKYEAFHALMEYIYTGQVNFDVDFYDSFLVLCRQCKLHALRATVESEYKMAQTKKHSRIIIKPPVYHAAGSPLYRDMRQALKHIVHEQATKSSLSSSLSELNPFQATFTDICLLVQELPDEDNENNTRALKTSINLHCFYAHRALLYSHSEYFKVMFTSQFIESSQMDKQNPYVELKDISPHIMGMVLEFMYTYHVDYIPDEHLMDLLAAAGLFLLPQLKKMCVNQLVRLLTLDNVFAYLYAADVFQASKLRDACYDLIEPSIEKVYKSAELEEFLVEGDKEAVTHLKHVIEDYEEHLEWSKLNS